jgi:hypothetical protein
MLHTCNMKLLRRAGLSLSVLLIPALVLNPAPASARVLDPGSPVTSWGNNGVVEHWESGANGDISITNQDVFEDNSGRYVFAARETIGVTEYVSVRAISANGTQAFSYVLPETTHDFTSVSQFDIDASGRYIVGAEVNRNSDYEFSVVRVNTNGSIDTSFASQGVMNFQTRINSYLNSLNSGCTGLISIKDLATDPLDSSIYILGSVTPYCTIAGFDSLQTRLWRIDSSGNIDTTFGTGTLEAFPITGETNVVPWSSGKDARIKTYDGLTLTILMNSRNLVNSINYFELFHQDIDITGATPFAKTQPNQKTFNASNEQSDLQVIDFDERYDGKISILGSESFGNESYSVFWFLNPSNNRWDYVEFETDCTYQSLVVDTANNTYVSKECGFTNSSYTDSILKYSPLGIRTSFIGPQGNFGTRSEIDYWRNKLFVNNESLTAIGTASNRIGTPSTSFVFGTRYHVNSVTIPDPPAPAAPAPAPAAPAPAPAPILAPALPAQSAPVAIPVSVKAKKKISFPLNSAAGNPLIVRVSGSCSLSPVFKKVKVKVGKKTKRVKQQTGWTVQMKKKKQTCTITQTDAGGNGYAALSSTSTVTIK